MSNFYILHGLEYELQLMVEINNELIVVDVAKHLDYKYSNLPVCVTFDMGNIEISTRPCETYFNAVEHANYILENKLVPTLINEFGLRKFALFLPAPMSLVHVSFDDITLKISIKHDEHPVCLKHWNISFKNNKYNQIKDLLWNYPILSNNYSEMYDSIEKELISDGLNSNWKYDYEALKNKKYPVLIKDITSFADSRVHIKIPYHYVPPIGNPDLMLPFEKTLLPPEGWKNIVGFYKNNKWTSVSKLI